MTEVTTVIAVDREHLAELREVWPTWQRWHPEICGNVTLYADHGAECAEELIVAPQMPDAIFNGTDPVTDIELHTFFRPTQIPHTTQKDRMLGGLLTEVPNSVTTDHWLKIDCDTIATGPGPPLTDFVEGVESIASSPWPYSKPVDAITQLNDWYGAVTGEPPLEGVQYRPDGHSRERERAYYPRVIGWITVVNTAFSRRVAEFLVKHPPPFISHDTLLWYLAERWGTPAKKIKFGRLGWDHRLGLQSIKKRVAEVMMQSEAIGWTSTATPESQTKKYNRSRESVLANLLAETYGISPIVGVEIGVHQAAISSHFLKQLPHLTMFMVDPWIEYKDKSVLERDHVSGANQAAMDAARDLSYKATEPYRRRRVILEMPSVDAAKILAGMRFDFVFIDAIHSYDYVAADLAAWWPLVKPGGLLCGHDYNHRRFKGVAKAVNEFAAEKGLQVRDFGASSVWMLTRN
jgi:hypothetical protein